MTPTSPAHSPGQLSSARPLWPTSPIEGPSLSAQQDTPGPFLGKDQPRTLKGPTQSVSLACSYFPYEYAGKESFFRCASNIDPWAFKPRRVAYAARLSQPTTTWTHSMNLSIINRVYALNY